MRHLVSRVVSVLVISCTYAVANAAETVMTVVITYGAPGHSSVHLQHAGQQLYWDPGGAYGTERDDCLADFSESYCTRFDGFPWDMLKKARQDDVFRGEAADLMQVISVYHLDGDAKIKIYRFDLDGPVAEKAWTQLASANSDFDTDRAGMFCVKGVTEYLETLGGQFANIEHPWYPEELGEEMAKIGATPSDIFTLHHPKVRQTINAIRAASGLPPKRFKNDWDVDEEDESSKAVF